MAFVAMPILHPLHFICCSNYHLFYYMLQILIGSDVITNAPYVVLDNEYLMVA